jgi:hypothetical protein
MMRTWRYLTGAAFAAAILAGSVIGIDAQRGHHRPVAKMAMKMNMRKMNRDPHHMLIMAYMKDMAGFARILRDQALTPKGPDVEFARAAVAELRHDLDSMQAIHAKHMAAMSADMKAKMKAMMEKMEKEQAMVQEHVVALESAVQVDNPNARQVAMHANDLVKQFRMMDQIPASGKTGKKKMRL